MALAVAAVRQPEFDQIDFSSVAAKAVSIQFDTSYPLNGYPLTPSTFGFTTKVVGVLTSQGAAARTGTYTVSTDHVTGKTPALRLFTVSAGVWTEVAATTNVAGVRIFAIALGY
jgi:hypothetical protein